MSKFLKSTSRAAGSKAGLAAILSKASLQAHAAVSLNPAQNTFSKRYSREFETSPSSRSSPVWR